MELIEGERPSIMSVERYVYDAVVIEAGPHPLHRTKAEIISTGQDSVIAVLCLHLELNPIGDVLWYRRRHSGAEGRSNSGLWKGLRKHRER